MALGSIPIILVGVEKGKIMREGERRKKRKRKEGEWMFIHNVFTDEYNDNS